MFDQIGTGNNKIDIFNNKNPERILSSTRLRFATKNENEMMIDIANYYRKQNNKITEKEITDILSKYAASTFGRVYYPQLTQFTNQGPIIPNGKRP